MRKNRFVSLLAVSLFSIALVSCTEEDTSSTTVAKATDFQLNFTTGEYSFTGTDTARTYCIRLFGFDEDGNEETSYTATSNNIIAEEGVTTYTGVMDLTDCTPGTNYNAYVLTRTNDYKKSLSDALNGTYIGVFDAPDATGITGTLDSGTATLTFAEATFEAYRELDPAPSSYTVTVYSGTTVVTTETVEDSALTVRDEEYTSGFGPMATKGTYHHRSGTLSFSLDAGSYTLTLKADALEGYYLASAESDAVTLA